MTTAVRVGNRIFWIKQLFGGDGMQIWKKITSLVLTQKKIFLSKKNPRRVAENYIVYNSEWLLMRNTSVITKQNKCNVFSYCINVIFFNCYFQLIAILWGAVLWPNVSNAKNEQPERNKKQSKRGRLQTNSLEDFFCWIAKFNYNEKNKDLNCYIFFSSELLGRFRFETKKCRPRAQIIASPLQQKITSGCKLLRNTQS